MGYRVAVVGATGNVGREMLAILEELEFPVDEIFAVASRKSIGLEVNFAEQHLFSVVRGFGDDSAEGIGQEAAAPELDSLPTGAIA